MLQRPETKKRQRLPRMQEQLQTPMQMQMQTRTRILERSMMHQRNLILQHARSVNGGTDYNVPFSARVGSL